MTITTILALSIGTVSMLILILILMKWYQVKLWKGIPVAILLTITGTLATYIWFFVESSWFGGRSYYGAVFLVPLAFVFIAKWLRIPYEQAMDFCAPAECAMLVIMKYQCLVDGCCAGIVLYFTADGTAVRFPSQMIEVVNALVLMLILMILAHNEKNRGKIYPWYLLLYGATRFVWNWFRADNTPMIVGLPEGNVWSLMAMCWGYMWLRGYKLAIVKNEAPQSENAQDECV